MLAVMNEQQRARAMLFLHDVKVSFPILVDDAGVFGGLYGVPNTPANYLIGADGKISFRSVGYEPDDAGALTAEVESALQRKSTKH